ncbi:MAG: aspartate/glutamate racemase family protein [Pseudomonadota bacterium]
MKVEGGRSIYGATLGILMLEARFPRIPGDMGHAASFPFPVQYRLVDGATPDRVVRRKADGLLDDFIDAGRDLIRHGCDGITTNCGFLALFQKELSEALSVPVATSSLMQVPAVNALLPPSKRAGILTISGSTLTDRHLCLAGAPPDTPVATTEGGKEFTRAILGDEPVLDIRAAEEDNVAAARRLCADRSVGAIVLECTNMTPYAAAIRQATGLPVFTMVNFCAWFYGALTPRTFPHPHPTITMQITDAV